MRRYSVVLLAVLAVAGIVWALGAGRSAAPPAVGVAAAVRKTLVVAVTTTGTVQAKAVDVSAALPGRITQVFVETGQAVSRGAPLFAIEAADLRASVHQAEAAVGAARQQAAQAEVAVAAAQQGVAQADAAAEAARAQLDQIRAGARESDLEMARAAVRGAESALDQAKRALATQEQLQRQGAVSQVQVDVARAQVNAALAQHEQAVAALRGLEAGARPQAIEAARAQVAQAEAAARAARDHVAQARAAAAVTRQAIAQAEAGLEAARARLAFATVRAPFDAVVTAVRIQPGAYAAPGVPAVSLADVSSVWVTADMDEGDVGRVKAGQRVVVTADAYPGQQFAGRVTRIGEQAEPRIGTRVVPVRIELDGDPRLRPGTSVDAEIAVEEHRGALVIPIEALVEQEDGASVYVVNGGVARRRVVQTGPSSETEVAITGGLEEGEQVAVSNLTALRDGTRVEVRR